MKLSKRPGLWLLWNFAAVLLLAGAYATHGQGAATRAAPQRQQPVTRPDTQLARRPQLDSVAPQLSGPPAPGVSGAAAPVDSPTAAATTPQTTQPTRARDLDTPVHLRLMSLVGMLLLMVIAWLLSVNRALVPWRIILWGTGLQLIFALLILKTNAGVAFFDSLNDVIVSLLNFTSEGARFLFGNLIVNNVPIARGEPGMGPAAPIPGMVANTGAFFAFSILPTIVFFSSLTTMLYYFGVLQTVVKGIAWVMLRTMRTSGAETLSAAGNIFLGQTEAPLLIKPYVAGMTMSELMAVMVGGFANIAGGVLAAFVALLVAQIPDIAGHLLAASVMSAPGTLVFAKLMYPETGEPATRGQLHVAVEKIDANVIDAAARGAGEGLHLAFNVGAMLLAFIAIIAVLNALLGLFGEWTRLADVLQGYGWLAEGQRLNLQSILGWLFAPLAWIMGVPWSDATTVGSLIGIKTSVNEFVAYLRLSDMLAAGTDLSPRSIVIASYALCGFANFSSIAIQIGGIGGMAPGRRSDLARLGLRAMIGGSLATFMTATIAGMLI